MKLIFTIYLIVLVVIHGRYPWLLVVDAVAAILTLLLLPVVWIVFRAIAATAP